MANERVTDQGYWLGDIQSALGTRDSGLTLADNALRLLATSTITPVIETLDTAEASPGLGWETSGIGAVYHDLSLSCYLRQPGLLSDPPVQAELAREFDVLMRASGWKRVLAASGKWASYYYDGNHSEAATLERYDLLAGNGDQNRKVGYDFQGAWSIAWRPKEFFTFTTAGPARMKDVTNPVEAVGSAWSGTITYQGGKPLIAKGAARQLVDLSDDSVYGGGTLGSPAYAVCILDFNLASNRAMATLDCDAADGGIKGAHGASAAVTGDMLIEAVAVGDYAPHNLLLTQQPQELRYSFPVPGFPALRQWTGGYLLLTAVETLNIQNGRGLYKVSFKATAPEDASDGSPAAATDPGQRFTAGTNAGVPNSDGSSAPIGARWWFQLVDSTV